MLFSQVKKRRCAICWGPVVYRWVGDDWHVVCPKGCEPGGHVSEEYVEVAQAHDAYMAAEVASNYPELVENQPSKEELSKNRQALFGEE